MFLVKPHNIINQIVDLNIAIGVDDLIPWSDKLYRFDEISTRVCIVCASVLYKNARNIWYNFCHHSLRASIKKLNTYKNILM